MITVLGWAAWTLAVAAVTYGAVRALREPSERDRIVAEARARSAVRTVTVTEWVTAGYIDAIAAEDPELLDEFKRLDDIVRERLRDVAIPEQREEEDR